MVYGEFNPDPEGKSRINFAVGKARRLFSGRWRICVEFNIVAPKF